MIKFAKTELAPRLDYRRLELEFEERLVQGVVPAPKHNRFRCATPIEFLRWQNKKKTLGEDAKDGDDAIMLEMEQKREKKEK